MLTAPLSDAPLLGSNSDRMTPRLVVAEDGRIVFASEGFEQLVRASAYALVGSKLQDLVVFCDPDQALRDSPFTHSPDSPRRSWCASIGEGIHKIRLRDRGEQSFMFQFNWMRVGTGERFLVACANDMGVEGPAPASTYLVDRLIQLRSAPGQQVPTLYALAQDFALVAGTPVPQGGDVFLDLSDDVMLRLAQDGRVEHANRAFLSTFGYTERQVEILNFLDLIAPDDRAHVRGIFLSLMHREGGAAPVSFESRAHDSNHKIRVMDWRLKHCEGHIFALGRDLTALRAHESRMARHQQQLSEAEAIAHMGYWRWQVGEKTLAWSDEIYRIFGVTRETFIPTVETVEAMLYRRDMGRVVQAFQRAMIEQNNYDMDFRITRAGGDVRYIRCEGRCDCDENGEVVALYGIMQDMTETALAERELREAKEAAERAYDSKSKFLANMSHELRTPLNAIIGFSEMMQRQLLGPIGTPKYIDYIDGIRQSGEHLLDLISDILDMSKIEAGKYALDLEDVNIAKLARLAISMVEGRARESAVDLGCNDFGDDMHAVADRRAVLQMMLNLLSNAIKFTESGGSVRLELSCLDEKIQISVIDTGIGIPAHMIDTVTKPFEQAASHYTRAHEGSGLGLAITKELALMHHGHLDIRSEVGKGTCVTITLPITQS